MKIGKDIFCGVLRVAAVLLAAAVAVVSCENDYDDRTLMTQVTVTFRLADGARAFLKDIDPKSRIVIFDDVMTTSATASECAKVLKAAGFEHIDAFSVFKRL